MKTLETKLHNGKPIFSWCPTAEQGAIDQVEVIAKLPFVEHIALMPDAHQGMDCPIGGVVACNNVIVPSFVGSDVGCGMACFRTSLTTEDIKGKEDILHHSVERSIPMGFSHNTDSRRKDLEKEYGDRIRGAYAFNIRVGFPQIVKEDGFIGQLGTLGGGNHFIEVQHDEENRIWVMVHSGSRNIGKRVCDYFNAEAEKLNNKWYSQSTIPFLPVDTEEGKAYQGWMKMALEFAFLNRKAMLEEIYRNMLHYFPTMSKDDIINIHHNYAALESHFGRNVWVHRKGATLASDKTVGIIPGSMGTASYIVKGLGKAESLNSCSHGSGRRMGRKVFNQAFNTPEKLKEIEESMNGITHTKFGKYMGFKKKDTGMMDVSEAPQAYKDIEEVIKNEEDLVRPMFKLLPLINWKDSGEE